MYSVSELTKDIRALLEGRFPEVWVSGEVTDFRGNRAGRHWYFSLKDESSKIRAIIFGAADRRFPFDLEDGLEVICRGKINVYPPTGQYSLIIDHVEPKGIGALQLAFEQLKKKLQAEGLFDREHKKSLPFLPKKIGVVTSPTGAAIRDILNILQRRFPSVDVLLVPALVQGEGAAQSIAEGIRLLNQREDIDVMIVGRGGGSMEDLWAFNEEVVARAIFDSRIPVISAVGHEIDFTIADFVADVRAPTPSAAAELAVPNVQDLLTRVGRLKERLKDPRLRFPDWLLRVDELQNRLAYVWEVGWERRSQHLKKLLSNLDHLSPLHVLAKGYGVVQKEGLAVPLKTNQGLKIGDLLRITFHQGQTLAKVTKNNV
ncbi:MAG: exodeoxyribonuclease VII large subunit [Deltaproteobacteria bacterium]|nr:exodeoxyribonuclease VII large subunit [Deltaproteobacteria bacterium]